MTLVGSQIPQTQGLTCELFGNSTVKLLLLDKLQFLCLQIDIFILTGKTVSVVISFIFIPLVSDYDNE